MCRGTRFQDMLLHLVLWHWQHRRLCSACPCSSQQIALFVLFWHFIFSVPHNERQKNNPESFNCLGSWMCSSYEAVWRKELWQCMLCSVFDGRYLKKTNRNVRHPFYLDSVLWWGRLVQVAVLKHCLGLEKAHGGNALFWHVLQKNGFRSLVL